MQVHAVPDNERVSDSTGRRLPWGYDFADLDGTSRRGPEERGPFGKARKRGTSRSKTATPAKKEDQAKLDNLRVIDDIFARHKAQEEKKDTLRRKASGTGSLPISASAPNLIEAGGLATSFQPSASTNTASKDPTECILYGYGSEVQWAAIDHFEKVSRGIIYEDYDRAPPTAKWTSTFTPQKATLYGTLTKASLRKLNQYIGGEHWIKVTFDSPEAAERACHYSPHVIQGYQVFCERYRGTGPNADRSIPAKAGGATSLTASPNTVSSTTLQGGQSSTTVSSATATGSRPSTLPPRLASEPVFPGADIWEDEPTALAPRQLAEVGRVSGRDAGRGTLRIRGAKSAVLLPAEKAFLPAAPRWQQTLGSWPIIGWVVGSGHGFIGDAVPRKEDGSFDNTNASLWWRLCYSVDSCFGTDFCGMRDAEYDE
ncbi:hypothetical protein EJ04DRAFT_548130 [Polyplosphaeria fusca]|uniref:Uncharacterized protein n=1 Tax=Polyplosphaeria fusca TaxID=682080 RepID=A0A9P4R8J8_9PLEO|nr:hypothetical protein EJ04DRAFT_548130 [Polyplosphaeria fusca]